MRHPHITLAAAAVVVGFALGATPASAAAPKLDGVSSQTAAAEQVRYRRYGYGYRPYRYYRPYPYYAPRRYYYGYPYRPYYRGYGYWYRPYYGHRYWW
jgi:hypothetical protein